MKNTFEPCGHEPAQSAAQLHGVCVFCYRDRLGKAEAELKALTAPVAYERDALAVRFTLYTDKKCFGNSFVVEKHDFPFLHLIFSARFKELACAVRDEEGK